MLGGENYMSKRLIIYTIIAFLIGVLGLLFSYHVHTSFSWICNFDVYLIDKEYKRYGGVSEFFWLIIYSIIFLITMGSCFKELTYKYFTKDIFFLTWVKKSKVHLTFLLLIFFALVIYNLVVAPINLHNRMSDPGDSYCNSEFNEYARPYFWYFLHGFTMYILFTIPMFFVARENFIKDRGDIKKKELDMKNKIGYKGAKIKIEDYVEDLKINYQDLFDEYVQRSKKYYLVLLEFICFLVLGTKFVFYSFTYSAKNIAQYAIILPLFAIVVLFAFSYGKMENIKNIIITKIKDIKNKLPNNQQVDFGKVEYLNKAIGEIGSNNITMLGKCLKDNLLAFIITAILLFMMKSPPLNARSNVKNLPPPLNSICIAYIELNNTSEKMDDKEWKENKEIQIDMEKIKNLKGDISWKSFKTIGRTLLRIE